MSLKNKKAVVIITGASRGLGRSISISLSDVVGKGSVFILIARSLRGLNETKELISDNVSSVFCNAMDNSKPNKREFSDLFCETLECLNLQASDFEVAAIVHNAGSIGNQGTWSKDYNDLQIMQSYFNLNLFSAMVLNAVFLQSFSATGQKLIVNISSLCGLQPFKTFSSYCTGKAARDMYFKVVGEEEKDNNVRVLNFAPGPVETEMVSGIIQGDQTADEIRKAFVDMQQSNQLLQPDQSAEKLVQVLLEDKYENGQHVDYFDEL